MTARRRVPRRIGRAVAAFAVAAAACWFVPGAMANDGTITFRCTGTQTPSPTQRECTPSDGQRIDAVWKIAFTAQAGTASRLRRVRLFILSEDPNILSPGQAKKNDPVPPLVTWGDAAPDDWSQFGNAPASFSPTYTWDTNVLTPYNGKFTIRVEALTHVDQSTGNAPAAKERVHVAVDNPPVTPGKPNVLLATPDGVSVGWAEATDPDFKTYFLWRARTSGPTDVPEDADFKRVLTTTKTQVFDEVGQTGSYWYKLQTGRNSVVSSDGSIKSELSERSRPGVVEPPPTPAPTPAPFITPAPTARVRPPALPQVVVKAPPVKDAPFAAVLPYPDDAELGPAEAEPPAAFGQPEERSPTSTTDRTAVLPVAVGAFLVSAALAMGRLPSGI